MELSESASFKVGVCVCLEEGVMLEKKWRRMHADGTKEVRRQERRNW